MNSDDPLAPVVEAIRRAFPVRPDSAVYESVLAVLHEEMSFRAAARALELAWGVDRIAGLHDGYSVEVQRIVPSEDVRRRLLEAGLPRE